MSRNPKRIPIILKQLEALWSSSPDLRLGQLILNALNGAAGNNFAWISPLSVTPQQLEVVINESKARSFDVGYNIEDERLLALISCYLKESGSPGQ